MARCIFCDEWAGPDSDRHERCALEFERQVGQLGLVRRFFTGALRPARALYLMVFAGLARTR